MTSILVYCSSTGFVAPEFSAPEPTPGSWFDDMDWCGVCGRATCHLGEHDDLVEAGLAEYRDGHAWRTAAWDRDRAAAVCEATYQAYVAAHPLPA